jgi:hypothetical protein
MLEAAPVRDSHLLPFTHDAFIDVFRVYSAAIWPAQVVAYLLGDGPSSADAPDAPGRQRHCRHSRADVALDRPCVLRRPLQRDQPGGLRLRCTLRRPGLLLAWTGAAGHLEFRIRGGARGRVGPGMIFCAMLLYPAIGALAGQSNPADHRRPPAGELASTPAPDRAAALVAGRRLRRLSAPGSAGLGVDPERYPRGRRAAPRSPSSRAQLRDVTRAWHSRTLTSKIQTLLPHPLRHWSERRLKRV